MKTSKLTQMTRVAIAMKINNIKQSKKVIAKKLHQSCDLKIIVCDLQHKEYIIIEASPKLTYKKQLNIFILSFRKEDINKLFGITVIKGLRVDAPLKKLT